MKDTRTGLQKLNDEQQADRISIFFAVQVITASILYLLFFVWQ